MATRKANPSPAQRAPARGGMGRPMAPKQRTGMPRTYRR